MNETIFRIMMHGLIALAPSSSGDPNHITALILDARMPHHEDKCVSGHHPELSFRVADIPENAGKCSAAGCTKNGSQCTCGEGLSGKKVKLELASSLSSPILESVDDNLANNHGLPSQAQMGSMRYVANLTKPPFSLKLLDPERMGHHLLARVEVPFEKLTSCSLSKREDQGDTYVIPMGIRGFGRRSRVTDRSQAFAQMVVAKFNVPAGQPVSITISDLDGTNAQTMSLAPGTNGYIIDLSNEPDDLPRGAPCDDGIARHFAHFYDFTENPPDWSNRMVPHARFTQGMLISGFDLDPAAAEPEECKDLTFNLMDRPICPMGSFIP